MDHFQHRDGVLYAEDVPLPRIAEEVGTPVYVYSRATLERHARVFREALSGLDDPHIAFAVKANPNLAVLKILANEGYGADVVSGGELTRALAAGMKPEDIVFSGVGKTHAELLQGLDEGIGQFNIESEEEGYELAAIARRHGKRAACALRVNPDVDARTHEKISTGKRENKFGVPLDRAAEIYAGLAREDGLDMRGIAVHIGSQLSSLEPLETAFVKVGTLIAELRDKGCAVTHADLGGGLGQLLGQPVAQHVDPPAARRIVRQPLPGQPPCAQRQRQRDVGFLVDTAGQLQRSTADVDVDDAPGAPAVPAAHRQERQSRFVDAAEHLQRHPGLALDAGEHVFGVLRVAHRRGRECHQLGASRTGCDLGEFVDRADQPVGAATGQFAGLVDRLGEPQRGLGGAHRGRVPAAAGIDHQQMNGIAAHVEHA